MTWSGVLSFHKQQILINNWQLIIEIANRHEALVSFEGYWENVHNFVMRVPLVGVFSAGKSTLINSLLGVKLLGIDIDPKTCIPTELHYGNNDHFVGCLPNGDKISLDKDDVANEAFLREINNTSEKQGWMSVYLNSPILAKFPHICLVDLPGLGSNFESHNQMIDDYIQRSLAYCIVVSIEDGELKESTQQFLRELKISQMPVMLIVTKIDRKPEDEVVAICDKIQKSITNLLDRELIGMVAISSRKGINIDKMIDSFVALELQAEESFCQYVVRPILDELNFLVQSLDRKINDDNSTIEKLLIEQEQLNKEMQRFCVSLDEEAKHLESKVEDIVFNIATTTKNQIMLQLDSLARQLVDSQNISVAIENIIRTALLEGIENQLKPAIRDYVREVQDDIPENLKVNNPTLNDINIGDGGLNFNSLLTTIAPALALLKVNPVLSVVLTTVVELTKLFLGGQKQKKYEQYLEMARQEIIYQVIPQAERKIQYALKNIVEKAIREAKSTIAQQAKERHQQFNAQLIKIKENLSKSEAEQQSLKQGYQTDKATIQSIIHQLI